MVDPATVLDELVRVIHARRDADPAESYTARLLQAGLPAIGGKVLEEADELVDAAVGAARGDAAPGDVAHEAADLVYHALVLLEASGVRWDEVIAELARRSGRSGLAEKASRTDG